MIHRAGALMLPLLLLSITETTATSRTPSPPVLEASVRPSPAAPSPVAVQSQTSLRITFFGLDLWSLCTWESDIQARVEARPSSSNLTLQYLTAPGMCYSQLKALNYTELLGTTLTADELMPGLAYFVADVSRTLRDYLVDKGLSVGVSDYCAGNRTESTFYTHNPTTPVNGTWSTLHVVVTVSSSSPQGLVVPPTTTQLNNLLRNCRGALTMAGQAFFQLYQMPFQRCLVERGPALPTSSATPPSPSPTQPTPAP
ncbi:hypothetical protein V8C86DRAFT_2802070 [Haematococcus lacustris]